MLGCMPLEVMPLETVIIVYLICTVMLIGNAILGDITISGDVYYTDCGL